jgi:hypothetical protein
LEKMWYELIPKEKVLIWLNVKKFYSLFFFQFYS